MLLVYADAVPSEVVEVLDLTGLAWKAVNSLGAAERLQPADGWTGALVFANDVESTIDFCRSIRKPDKPLEPLLLAINTDHLNLFELHQQLYDDFIATPLRVNELTARLKRMMWNGAEDEQQQIVEYGSLVLNLSTYQAAVAGRPLDMTYMEYELLRHFVANPSRVLTREELLRQVWGYEYYGGARTVDVHVRRLRAKLGDEHAALIQTVRSVGYIFGRSRWSG